MKLSCIAASELDARHRATWLTLRRENPALASPYFCPELTLAAGAVRNDVRVTVIEYGGRVVGFFPFQRGPMGAGYPVAGRLSDAHGLVVGPDVVIGTDELLRASDLAFWEFDHLVGGQRTFLGCEQRRAVSPALDLSEGYAAYRAARLADGSGRIRQLERKARKLAREVGPLHFEPHVEDRAVLEFVFREKSAQCRRTGVPDFFELAWTRGLVERILEAREPHFAGMLSALYAGDRLVAAHMGMRSDRVWHWWFPVYERSFAPYSPGGILLLRVAEAAAARGLQMLELGKGDDPYKESFANVEIPLYEGCAARPSVGASLRRFRAESGRLLRASPFVAPVRRARRWMRRQSYA